MTRLADELRLELRSFQEPAMRHAAFVRALETAHRVSDFDSVADLAVMEALTLESQGRASDAVAQLDFGLLSARDAPSSRPRTHLLAVKAGLLASAGDLTAAQQAIEEGHAGLPLGTTPRDREAIELAVYEEVVNCIGLRGSSTEDVHALASAASSLGLGWLSAGLKAWMVPWLAATAALHGARAWSSSMRAEARASGHVWRELDAESFDVAFASVTALQRSSDLVERARSVVRYRDYQRRMLILAVFNALRAGELTAARACFRALNAMSDRMPPSFADSVACFGAVLDAYEFGEIRNPPRPAVATLLNLPAALAGGEAVAIAGRVPDAREWHRWLTAEVPRIVATSIEWPTSLQRIIGLLELRLGDQKVAARSLRASVEWASSLGYEIEAAVGSVQLAQVLGLGRRAVPERDWRGLRAVAARTMRGLGADPAIHAAAAAGVVALARVDGRSSVLTSRELEVLSSLAAGLSYRETAARLGLKWQTVQVHARNIYRKLNVSGRVEAVNQAQRLRLL